jgi:hypothetical protein
MLIRIRDTGAVITDGEFRTMHGNTSFPQQLTVELLDSFGADPVLEGAQPTGEPWQYPVGDGVEEIGGQWFTKWTLGPTFATPEEEAAYIAAWEEAHFLAVKEAIATEVLAHLDAFAQTKDYEDMTAACTYVNSTIPEYAANGATAIGLRDQTRADLALIWVEVEMGLRPMPNSYSDIAADLPTLTW